MRIFAKDQLGTSESATMSILVNTPVTLSGGGDITASYGSSATSSAFSASGGTPSYTYSIAKTSDATAVSGISIGTTSGIVAASATTPAGTYAMSVKATDSVGATGTKTLTITINPTVEIGGGGSITTSYGTPATSTAFTATGGTGTKTFSITQSGTGNTIIGISIDTSTGVVAVSNLAGAGNYTMIVRGEDASGSSGTRIMSITVSKIALSTPTLNNPTSTVLKEIATSWSAVTHKSGYKIKIYDESGLTLLATVTESSEAKTLTASNYSSIADSTEYKITVTAVGDSNYSDSNESSQKSVITKSATAQIPTITSQPQSITKSEGTTTQFSVSASVTDGGALSYQWEYQIKGSGTWNSIGTNSNQYATPTLSNSYDGNSYRVKVTNTKSGSSATATSDSALLTIQKENQDTLTVTSTSGTVGTNLSLTTSGGNTNLTPTFAVENGSATAGGSTICAQPRLGILSINKPGTCFVTATMAGNGNYESVSSVRTTVTFQESSGTRVVPVIPASISYGTSTPIEASVNVAGKVDFLQNGRIIPKCSALIATPTKNASCPWIPSIMGSNTISMLLTPSDNSLRPAKTEDITVTVNPR
jgi:hypothetical protein